MKESLILRSSLLALGLGAAFSAQAVTIGLSSVGTFDNTKNPVLFNETVLAQQGGFGPLSTYTASFDVNTFTGTATYTGTGGSLSLAYTVEQFVSFGISQSIIGRWVETAGTGTYANTAGTGTYAIVADVSSQSTHQDSFTTMRGSIAAVPEPASIAALGVGALGLLGRRRKS